MAQAFYVGPSQCSMGLNMGYPIIEKGLIFRGGRECFRKLTYLSGVLGAKQLVVVITQTTFSVPKSLICFSTAARSVRSSSPSITFATITGSNPKEGNKEHRSVTSFLMLTYIITTKQLAYFTKINV